MDDRPVGVELLRRVAAVVGESLDQVLVTVAELVLGHARDRERPRQEVLQQVLQRGVGQPLLVGPRGVAEDPVESARIRGLDGAECLLESAPTSLATPRTSFQWAPSGITYRSFAVARAYFLSPVSSIASPKSASQTSESRL